MTKQHAATPDHEPLGAFAGAWETEGKLYADPASEPLAFHATNTYAWLPDGFSMLQGEHEPTDYRHTPPSRPEPFLHLYFCSRCGVRAFSKGEPLPELGGQFHAVNVACLDDATDEELARTPVHYPDGRHDDWKSTAEYRYL